MSQHDHSFDDLEAFKGARDRLRSDPAIRAAGGSLHKLVSNATLSRLLKSEEEYSSESFSPAVRERLIWSLNAREEHHAYSVIEGMMGQSQIGRQIIRDNFQGDYVIFRYAKSSNAGLAENDTRSASGLAYSANLALIEDRLRIFFDDQDEPAFQYWSDDDGQEDPDPRISGAVFYSLGKLFLTGAATDTMSMAIIQVTRTQEPMEGIWMSTTPKGVRAPFSARIVMTLDSNKAAVDRLRDVNDIDDFLKITQGGYPPYMTMD